MRPSFYRPTVVTVNRQAIRNNFKNEKKILDDDTAIFAVLKANAYGHGVIEVAKTLSALNVDGFCVATLDEGIELRKNGIKNSILVLGITPVNEAEIAAKNNISLAVATKEWLEAAIQTLTTPLKIHLALDTGMGRIGFLNREAVVEASEIIKNNEKLIPEGIFTHFSTADEKDTDYFNQQVNAFKNMTQNLPIKFKYRHCANSATSLWHLKCQCNMIRFGAALYGLNPSGTVITDLPYDLQPALSLSTEIVYIKRETAGKKISYGATYTTFEGEIIATLPIGYADGWSRSLTGSEVLIDGERCPIVGRICMDQMMVSVPKMYPVGTKVTLIGQNGSDGIDADEIARYRDTINYEVVCDISDRVPRKYVN